MNVSPVWVVIAKEIIDNLRDRQTLFYALLFGPVLLPLLLGGSLAMTFKQLSIDFDSVTTLPVRHADRAPELMRFLEGQNVDAVAALWEQTNNSLRLQHRGLDPTVFDSLDLVTDDVSNDGASGQLLASLLPFLFIVSMTMGGFYLAIDTTAGERERRSLEPLLGLPIARRDRWRRSLRRCW